MISYFQHIVRHASVSADCPAISIGKETIHYQELISSAVQVAQQIDFKNQNVGLYTDNNLDMYISLLAIWISGNAYVPLNHKFPSDRLFKIIEESKINCILGSEQARKNTDGLHVKNWIVPEYNIEEVLNFPEITLSEKAYTLFTSGSTGVPKGIPITHQNVDALMMDMVVRYPLNSNNKVLQAFELSFDVNIACVLIALTQGAHLVVADLNGITAINAFKAIHESQVDFVVLPPSALFYIKKLRLLQIPQPQIKTTLFTGEALPWNVVQDWKTCATQSSVDNAYGPTEGTVWATIDRIDEDTEQQVVNGLCPIGQPLQHIQYKIIDEQGIPAAQGQRGELWIGGDQIFDGYVHLPEKTNEVLVKENGIRWYKTGDIVMMNDHQKIMYVNRKDNQVQINGYRVELGEVEHHLRNWLGHDAAVVLAKTENNVTELFAFIEGTAQQESEAVEALRKIVPGYMVPRRIFALTSLPINSSGKIDKSLLRNTYLQNES
jgi:amino acid adenylation domain-containing protein